MPNPTNRPASIPPRALRARRRRLAFRLRDQATELERAALLAGTHAFARLAAEFEATKTELASLRTGVES